MHVNAEAHEQLDSILGRGGDVSLRCAEARELALHCIKELRAGARFELQCHVGHVTGGERCSELL